MTTTTTTTIRKISISINFLLRITFLTTLVLAVVVPSIQAQPQKKMGVFFSKKVAAESKVIFITGASAGIGKSCALSLLERGHVVYGAARRVDKMHDIVAAGGHALAMDVTNEQQIIEAVNLIITEQGQIDVLVNNAGFGIFGSVEDIAIDDAKFQFEVNLFGLARLTKEVLPYMRARRSGRIINISSIAGKVYSPFGAWYYASKHALEGWSDCLRLELNPFNIKVSIVEPGAIKTEFGDLAHEPLLASSIGSVYEPYVKKALESRTKTHSKGSSPSVIANVVIKACESRYPKRRYVAGAFARTALFMRKWVGDSLFDWVMLRAMTPK